MCDSAYHDCSSASTSTHLSVSFDDGESWDELMKRLRKEEKLLNKQTLPCRPRKLQQYRKNNIYRPIQQRQSQRAN